MRRPRALRQHERIGPSRRRPFRRPRSDLILFNGLGGFTADGREYVITTTLGQVTPSPWVNVLANSQFRHRDLRERAGVYLERERSRVPADTLV